MLYPVLVAVFSALAFAPLSWMRFGVAGLVLLPFIGSSFAFLAIVQLYFRAPDEPEGSETEAGL